MKVPLYLFYEIETVFAISKWQHDIYKPNRKYNIVDVSRIKNV